MRRLHPNYITHAVAVGLMLVSVAGQFTFPAARASGPTASPTPTSLLGAMVEPLEVFDRSPSISERTSTPSPSPTPTPLPTPVAPKGTPFPVTRYTPVPTPTPTPVPVAFVGWPVASGDVSQYFSAAHPALDIASSCGVPVVAVWSGTIVFAGWKNNGGGYVVDIQFDNGLVGSYNHLSAIYVAGGWVNAGTALGAVGTTGISTGCHLHFALISGGRFVDPLAFLAP